MRQDCQLQLCRPTCYPAGGIEFSAPLFRVLILASASPRRREILQAAAIPHVVHPANILEERLPNEPALSFVERMALEKAGAVPLEHSSDIILAADTVVTIDHLLFGKPVDDQDVSRMLRILSGRTHLVTTAICLRSQADTVSSVCSTSVEFLQLTEEEIQDYTYSGEGRDKAGAYGIQGRGGRFVQRIVGCYHNVVGLPLSLVYTHLRKLDYL